MYKAILVSIAFLLTNACQTTAEKELARKCLTQKQNLHVEPAVYPTKLYVIPVVGETEVLVLEEPKNTFPRTILDKLEGHSQAYVLSRIQNGWYQVELGDGKIGYISNGRLSSVLPDMDDDCLPTKVQALDEKRYAKLQTTRYSILVRRNPKKASPPLTYIAPGEIVHIIGITPDQMWYKVEVDSGNIGITPGIIRGFVKTDDLVTEKIKSQNNLPNTLSRLGQHHFRIWQEKLSISAFAIGPGGAWGYSYGYKTEAQARIHALRGCSSPSCYIIAMNSRLL